MKEAKHKKSHKYLHKNTEYVHSKRRKTNFLAREGKGREVETIWCAEGLLCE